LEIDYKTGKRVRTAYHVLLEILRDCAERADKERWSQRPIREAR
jgi:hypothetical protein